MIAVSDGVEAREFEAMEGHDHGHGDEDHEDGAHEGEDHEVLKTTRTRITKMRLIKMVMAITPTKGTTHTHTTASIRISG